MTIAVVGAGLAGLAAVTRLRTLRYPAVAYEAGSDWGGHARAEEHDGFTFDEGPHVSFTADPEVRQLFASGAGDVREIPFRCGNIHDGRRIPHPVQCHLHGLAPAFAASCILDLAAAREPRPSPDNYYEWCVDAFGRTFTDRLTCAYTRKYWTVEPADMSTDWIGTRVYRPTLEDVVRGALEERRDDAFHYLSTVRYPARGGFRAFARALYTLGSVIFGKRVTAIDPRERVLFFGDRTTAPYDRLISTMPLPELVACIAATMPVPADVRAAADRLVCTSLLLVDVAVDLADFWTSDHVMYVYDEDVSASRLSFPHLLSTNNCPPGTGSVQAEIYSSRARPLREDPATLADQTVRDLVRLGIVPTSRDVRWVRHRTVPYANVAFTRDRAAAVTLILHWLAGLDVAVAGRYGEWAYYWTDDAVRSGWRAADLVTSRREAAYGGA